jgi:hypothetical protein
MKKEIKPELKQKILKRINDGQTKKMILWEFKIDQRQLNSILKEFGVFVRDRDAINFANKLYKTNRT